MAKYVDWLAEIERDPVAAPIPTHSQEFNAVVLLAIERGMPISVWLARALKLRPSGCRLDERVLWDYAGLIQHHYNDCAGSAHVKQIRRLRGY